MNKIKAIPARTIFTITSGEYSDYTTLTTCKSLKDINIKDLQKEYFAIHQKQKEDYEFNESQFIVWLVNEKHYAEEIGFMELHLGPDGYADFELKKKGGVINEHDMERV